MTWVVITGTMAEMDQSSRKTNTAEDYKNKYCDDQFSEEDEPEELLGSDDDEQEDPKDYCKGGYHLVKIGDLFNGKYHVVRKLGWGHFSTVWLAWDLKDRRYVALKVVKSAAHYTETAVDEIKLLKCVREADDTDENRLKVVQLLDDFKVSGVNGTHVCMVFEVLGNNLLKPIIQSKYMGMSLHIVKSIIRQVLEGLDYLHTKCKIIHTDIKPENILVCVDEFYIRNLAQEAKEWMQGSTKPPISSVSTAPVEKKPAEKMSKNKKKKLKKKQKRQLELLQQQEKQLLDLDVEKKRADSLSLHESISVSSLVLSESASLDQDSISQGPSSYSLSSLSLEPGSLQVSQSISQELVSVPENCVEEKCEPQQCPDSKLNTGIEERKEDRNEREINQENVTHRPKQNSDQLINIDDENNPTLNKKNLNETSIIKPTTNGSETKTPLCNGHTNNMQENSSSSNGLDDHNQETEKWVEKTVEHIEEQKKGTGNIKIDNIDTTLINTKDESPDSTSQVASPKDITMTTTDLEAEGNEDVTTSRDLGDINVDSTDQRLEDVVEVDYRALDYDPNRGIEDQKPIHDQLKVKIADLGNACWTNHHFTEDIQTRQYRALEVLLGAGYDTAADIWSTACMAFELATGDYLFEPHSGENYSRDEDHIAHILELVGIIPKHIAFSGKYSREFFNKKGELRNIKKLKPWDMYSVLREKYEWNEQESEEFVSFLLPMLEFDPSKRATARECLQQKWLYS
ncbi:SRSF protein kinase 3-like isoform X2 [Anneissia japonica]|uniref:SRSF protein kinase 3-like isoform X2 n=1 Tax=Anneissia japonica TaxID=1529436 RepID=UPI001425A93C|nr:SRSF protein kinase 3-like isoform X2 [Anneissia japonica]